MRFVKPAFLLLAALVISGCNGGGDSRTDQANAGAVGFTHFVKDLFAQDANSMPVDINNRDFMFTDDGREAAFNDLL